MCQHLRFRATLDQIKKSYRQCILKYHPDKLAQQEGLKEEAKQENGEEGNQSADDLDDINKKAR